MASRHSRWTRTTMYGVEMDVTEDFLPTKRPLKARGVTETKTHPIRFMWQPLRGSGWPHVGAGETRFINALRNEITETREENTKPIRDGMTLVLDALRCGVSVPYLRKSLPGCSPLTMVDAYEDLQSRIDDCSQAWLKMTSGVSNTEIEELAARCRPLLPVPTQRVVSAMASQRQKVIAEVTTQMQRASVEAQDAERRLLKLKPGFDDEAKGMETGSELYDPTGHCLWGAPYFLPSTPGQLVPTRVAYLLNERIRRR